MRQTILEWCRENYNKFGIREELINKCIKALGVTRDRVVKVLKENSVNGALVLKDTSPPTIREWCQTHQNEYKTKEELIINCVNNLGVTRDRVLRILNENSGNGVPIVGLNKDELKFKYDVLYKIEQAVKHLPEDRYVPDAEFREFLVEVDTKKYRSKANLPQFDKYKGAASGVVYWAKPENIKRLKEAGVLA